MKYFSRFPELSGYQINDRIHDAMDITIRTGIVENLKQNPSAYIEHVIDDGETSLILADRIYDSVELYWVILMFNNILDEDQEWPLTTNELNDFIQKHYDDPYGVHHYESKVSNAVVESDHPLYDRVPITNWEYESRINDEKRNIKILIPEYVSEVVSQHNELVSQ